MNFTIDVTHNSFTDIKHCRKYVLSNVGGYNNEISANIAPTKTICRNALQECR